MKVKYIVLFFLLFIAIMVYVALQKPANEKLHIENLTNKAFEPIEKQLEEIKIQLTSIQKSLDSLGKIQSPDIDLKSNIANMRAVSENLVTFIEGDIRVSIGILRKKYLNYDDTTNIKKDSLLIDQLESIQYEIDSLKVLAISLRQDEVELLAAINEMNQEMEELPTETIVANTSRDSASITVPSLQTRLDQKKLQRLKSDAEFYEFDENWPEALDSYLEMLDIDPDQPEIVKKTEELKQKIKPKD